MERNTDKKTTRHVYYILGWGWGINQSNHKSEKWTILSIVFSGEEIAKECQVPLKEGYRLAKMTEPELVGATFLKVEKRYY